MSKTIKKINIDNLHSNFKAITTGKPQGGYINLDPKLLGRFR